MIDEELRISVEKELQRQRSHIELIASENFVSQEVLEMAGSVLTNKYAEGYPGKRYYGGCQYVDEVEVLAIERLKKLFGAEHANVQPHSGSQANMGVYMAVLEHGDKVLGMSLNDGGHLTHGHPLNFSGLSYDFHAYGVDQETETINYDEVRKLALEIKPKLIVAGASAYPRAIDFKKFREIADEVGAYLMVDMAHIAGLVAAGLHQNPVLHAHFVTSTTHKTLRGPRGGIILCKEEFKKKIDQSIFPGSQGGPLMHIIAAKAVAFKEAMSPEFVEYQRKVIENAKTLELTLKENGFRVISGGTDNHLVLIDVKQSVSLTGLEAQVLLDSISITTNKNSIPFDKERPMVTSGLRLGTPAITTRGFTKEDIVEIANIISDCLKNSKNEQVLNECRKRVEHLTNKYPIYQNLTYI